MMGERETVCVLLAACLVGIVPGCSPSPEPVEQQVVAADPLEGIGCVNFNWVDHPGVANRAAMIVPVVAGGATLGFQLDTGAEVSFVPGGSASKHRIETFLNDANGKTFSVPTDLQVAGVHYPAREILVATELSRSEPAGTVGLDLLLDRITVLDLPYARFCLTEPGLPGVEALLERTEFSPATLRDGKLFVEARLGDEPLDGLLFDTGASAFPLQVDLDLWQRLTGREGDEQDNVSWQVSNRGERVTFIGAPALGRLKIGQLAIDVPMVFFRQDRPLGFTEWPIPIRGLLGNALFYEHTVVLDLRASAPRFGILPGRIS